MQIRSRVIAGADHVVDLHFFRIGFFAVETDLPATLVKSAVACTHRVVRIGARMQKLIAIRIVLNRIRCGGPVKGAAHAGVAVGGRDLRVTRGANYGIGSGQ